MVKIPVVYTTDDNYAIPTCVAIMSLLEKAHRTTYYDIYIVLTHETLRNYRDIFERIKCFYTGFNMTFLFINDTLFQNAEIRNSYLTHAAYYRLYISELIGGYDKCIYMDGDVLVEDDLGELYSICIDEYYVAGVKDMYTQLSDAKGMHRELLGIPTMRDYIYSGMLLMNLKKLREDQMVEKFQLGTMRKFKFEDQDVINSCCFGGIKHLPVRYNFLNRFLNATQLLSSEIYSEYELCEAESPVIVHFPGWIGKPWNNIRHKGGEQWWTYAERLLPKEIYLSMYEKAKKNSEEMDWTNFCGSCKEHSQIVIFGYSDIGRMLLDNLLVSKIESVVCFCDNDKNKQYQYYRCIPVLSLEEAIKKYPQCLFINVSQIYYKQINQQLSSAGVPEQNILVYFHKDMRYYMELENEFYEHELRQIYVREYGNDISLFLCYLKNLIFNTSNDKEIINKYWMSKWIFLDKEKETIGVPWYRFPFNELRRGERLVLYGAGEVGEDYHIQILQDGRHQLVLWVDEKWQEYQQKGMGVQAVSTLLNSEFDRVVIAEKEISVANKIKEQLIELMGGGGGKKNLLANSQTLKIGSIVQRLRWFCKVGDITQIFC